MSDEVFGAYGHANMIRRAYARGYARVHGRGHASLRDDADVRILRDVFHIRIYPTLRQ
jgi:hypothetical protein